ncbi:hypothetical protein EUTSA_v10000809mg [Eutrema salsugineum]|uniref:Zinc finger PHD-type domain-containing protein n=1 Tax=Eutrema salsugineum TaxID=72664 RepID=V4LID7_EUTSA|nr:uncharacterized protein LOC18016146 [Eutrema salsugineum]ESQ39528.1 hypothetical protein EUTSA_v10000809mg [Eutrema salsugineum]
MDPLKVEIPFHEHPLTLVKMESECKWCRLTFKGVIDGYQCDECIYGLFHKSCAKNANNIVHPSQKCSNTLYLTIHFMGVERCALCRGKIQGGMFYVCNDCALVPKRRFRSSSFHFYCAKYPPPKVIDVPQHHHHKLELEMTQSCFTCAACRKDGDGYPYKCYECDLTFHVDCERHGAEIRHASHSLHPLKLFKGEPPAYTDGKCRLCGERLVNSEVFYHCSICNFSLDLQCVHHPPPLHLQDLNTHDHKLTLMPKSISFTCTICGLNGDRSPYVCLPCDFTAHNDCSGFPLVININRHDHRVSRTSLLGVVNAVCGVCQKKMDWSCGGYSCTRCPGSVYHTKCSIRKDVSDGKEMKDEPEEDEAIEPFKVIDENTIQHNLHKEHNLRLDKSGIFIEERSCEACTYPIYHLSFYYCESCSFILHESCANLPMRKRHVVSNEQYTFKARQTRFFDCDACGILHNGFGYYAGKSVLDVRCASVIEPFVHQSHPHPLFYTSPRGICSACNQEAHHVLRCVEDDCGYVLDFKCALLPYEVKHRVDEHFLSLKYGENASGKYWCDICEKETDPKTWFYTSKDCELTLHTDCVLGGSPGLLPGYTEWGSYHDGISTYYKVVRNNSMSRPLCNQCKSRCISPVILEVSSKSCNPEEYYCDVSCFDLKYPD